MPRISKTEGVFMIGLAALFDFFQFVLTIIPFIGWILSFVISIVAYFLFWLWFAHRDVSLFAGDRILATMSMMVVEAVPFINGFPWLTARVFYAVHREWSSL